jgi:hypothetical protein
VAPSSPSAVPFPGDGSGVGIGGALLVIAGFAIGVGVNRLLPPVAQAAAVDPALRAAVAITAALACGCAGAALVTAALPVAGILLVPALHVWTMLERVTRGGAVVRALAILLPLVIPAVLITQGANLDAGEAVRLISDGRMPIGAAIGAALTLAAGAVLAARFIVPQRDVA